MHLTEQTLRQLLDGTMDPTGARALAAHLESNCPECEAILATGVANELDGRADRALTALSESEIRPEEAGNDLEFARIRRRMRSERSQPRSQRRRWERPLAIAAALTLMVGVAVKLGGDRISREARWDGAKGSDPEAIQGMAVRLSAVAVQTNPNGEPRLWKLSSGEVVPNDVSVQLQLELDGPADVAVARVGPGNDSDVFWHERVATRTATVSVAGQPAAYSLTGYTGRQRLVVLASPEPLSPERIQAAVQALAPPANVESGSPALRGLQIDILELNIQ